MTGSQKSNLIAILSAALLVFGFGPCEKKNEPVAPVGRYEKVQRRDLVQRVTFSGVVEPFRKSLVVAPFDGYVKKVMVTVGQKVQPNDRLVVVDQNLSIEGQAFPLRAPFSGVVTQVMRSEGDFVKKGDEKGPILRLDDMTKLFVVGDLPELEVLKVAKGQEVLIRAVSVTTKTYKGVVREIALAPKYKDPWSNSRDAVEYPIRVEIIDFDASIKPGMSVVVDVIAQQKKDILVLPHEFIHEREDSYFVVTRKGQEIPVKLGLQNELMTEVEGVPEGTDVRQVDFYEESRK